MRLQCGLKDYWYPIVRAAMYTVSAKKWNHSIFCLNFAKCCQFQNSFTNRLSDKFLAVLLCKISHHTSNASLHYLVKY